MINRTLALIFFFMVSVVLYYQNQNLSNENKSLKSKLKSNKPTEQINTKRQYSDNDHFSIIEDLQNKLNICESKKSSQTILNLIPLDEPKKQYHINQNVKEFEKINPYNYDKNSTKKENLKISPDVIYDKEKADLSLRLELKKQF